MRGAFAEFEKSGVPKVIVDEIKKGIDFDLRFFETSVSTGVMLAVIIGTISILLITYVFMNKFSKKKS